MQINNIRPNVSFGSVSHLMHDYFYENESSIKAINNDTFARMKNDPYVFIGYDPDGDEDKFILTYDCDEINSENAQKISQAGGFTLPEFNKNLLFLFEVMADNARRDKLFKLNEKIATSKKPTKTIENANIIKNELDEMHLQINKNYDFKEKREMIEYYNKSCAELLKPPEANPFTFLKFDMEY